MKLHLLEIGIVVAYFAMILLVGLWVSRRGSRNILGYVLGGKTLPWYLLGISNASGMFDVSGTMWAVYSFFIYGMKCIWLPFMWPTFIQVFQMVYMSKWTRRSRVMTGAEWIRTRFGSDRPAVLAHLSVVVFALVTAVGLLTYEFEGVGKFAAVMLPWHLTDSTGVFSDAHLYAIIIMGLTLIYAAKGGMISVVITEVAQFVILTATSIAMGVTAFSKVTPAMIRRSVPAGWMNPFFGWKLNLNWTGIMDSANTAIHQDGFQFFAAILALMLFKGVLASMAGPTPNFDMQRILATRSPREASLMSSLSNVLLMLPSWTMIAGIGALGTAFCLPDLRAMRTPDFERLLPIVLSRYVPAGLVGFILAGFISSFMASFSAAVNVAPAYLVNDIYKRFFNSSLSGHREVVLCRVAMFAVLAVGIGFGLVIHSIEAVMLWVAGALGAGYVIPNVLKWYWWRFTGMGYFWGMAAGIVGALAIPAAAARMFPGLNVLYTIPAIFAVSAASCLAGTFFSEPEDEAILVDFYRTVRPWGAWGPIRERVMREDPGFRPNRDCGRDWINVCVGIVWQVSMIAAPIYLVLRGWGGFWISIAILAGSSLFLKFNWYDRLEKDPPTGSPEAA